MPALFDQRTRRRLARTGYRDGERASIARENSRRGTAGWRINEAPAHALDAFASSASVRAGEPFGLHVSTIPAAGYAISVYRLGHYGGAGARLIVGMQRGEWRIGHERQLPAADPQTGLVRAQWPVTDYVQTGEEWPSGQYLVVLALVDGEHAGTGSYVPFVVRRRAGSAPAPVLLQMPVTTAQAHNDWGGRSMATSEPGVASSKVSFDRPFPPLALADPSARWPLCWDLPLLRFLECEGIELDYAADLDIHREPERLLEHRLVILSGHGAHWSPSLSNAVDAAIRRGVSVACMAADTGSRCVEYEDEERTILAMQGWGESWLDRSGLRPSEGGGGAGRDAHAVRFEAPSQAIVFSAGSLGLSSGLGQGLHGGAVDARLQRSMRGTIADLLRDRRVDEQTAAERELARLSGQSDGSDRLGLLAEIPVRATAQEVWPALAEMLTESRRRMSTTVAAWDANFHGNRDSYLDAGQSALWNIARALAGAGTAVPETILDLPCGTGRVTRALRAAWPEAQLVAADVSDPAINFCAANFGAEPWRLESYMRIGAVPHRDRYDLIWCSALLSQVIPVWVDRCMSSLLAMLRPNGVLVAAYHGRDSANRFRSSADPGLRGLAESLARSGNGFHARDDGSGLGVAVLSPHWLVAKITPHRGAMLLSLTERGWLDHLDVVAVMRKDIHHAQGNIELD
jgi:SAM-dependent methyltransferase